MPTTVNQERTDLLQTLATHRYFLQVTVQGMSDSQAREHPTVSELCLGGLIKHVAAVESGWVDFILQGPEAMSQGTDEAAVEEWLTRFQMLPEESLASVLERYGQVAARTDDVITQLANLDDGHPLPEAPWFEKGASWSARRVILHIIAETAQHAGHADILRESIDGAKTMG
jgi:uncharacterized damage-inducible protein DinB